jgi:hypothetical protein
MKNIRIEITASIKGKWKSVLATDLAKGSDGSHRGEGRFEVEESPDFLECTFFVEGLPQFTISPESVRGGIMTGSLSIKNRLFFITIVPDGKIYNYNAGFILKDPQI